MSLHFFFKLWKCNTCIVFKFWKCNTANTILLNEQIIWLQLTVYRAYNSFFCCYCCFFRHSLSPLLLPSLLQFPSLTLFLFLADFLIIIFTKFVVRFNAIIRINVIIVVSLVVFYFGHQTVNFSVFLHQNQYH